MHYKDILNFVGYPDTVIVIDFESYHDSDYTFDKLSTVEYVLDDRFEVTGCGFWVLDHKPVFYPQPKVEILDGKMRLRSAFRTLQGMYGKNLEGCTVVMQNAKFDALVLKHHYNIEPPHIIDTKDLANHYDARMSHKLKDLAKMFKLGEKGDTTQFKGLHADDILQDDGLLSDLERYTTQDVTLEGELFKMLLPKITNPEMEIPLARHTLGIYLNPAISFDYNKAKILLSGMEAEKIKAARQWKISDLSGNKSFRLLLEAAMPGGEKIPMKQGKKKMIPALAQNDDGMKGLLTHECATVRNLAKARQAVKSWPLHIKRIKNMVAQADAWGGKLGMALNYYAAHTGRFGGTEKINVQNFGGRGRAGKGIHPLIGQVRELLIAGEGQKFIVVDSAQIEARLLAWFAGQKELITGFANDEDVYSEFATDLFGVTVRKPKKNDPKLLYDHNQIKRGFGKDAILGAGYGMGAKKFYSRCMENDSLRPLFDSGTYDFRFIDKLIKTYRNKYTMIPEFWTTVEKCFKWVTKYPHEIMRYADPSTKVGTGHDILTFWNEDGTVMIQLPSGRCLRYRHASLDRKKQLSYHWGHLWGGSITENIVQATARDLLGHWILECERLGLRVVLHVHDETVGLVEEEVAEESLATMSEIVCSGPLWSEGLPLGAEGCIGDFYGK